MRRAWIEPFTVVYWSYTQTPEVSYCYYKLITNVKIVITASRWRSGLRHCIAVLAVPPETLGSIPGTVAAGRDREAHGAAQRRRG